MIRYEKDKLIIEVSCSEPEYAHFQLVEALMQITTYLCDKPVADSYVLNCLSSLTHFIGVPLSQPSKSIARALKESYEVDQQAVHTPTIIAGISEIAA